MKIFESLPRFSKRCNNPHMKYFTDSWRKNVVLSKNSRRFLLFWSRFDKKWLQNSQNIQNKAKKMKFFETLPRIFENLRENYMKICTDSWRLNSVLFITLTITISFWSLWGKKLVPKFMKYSKIGENRIFFSKFATHFHKMEWTSQVNITWFLKTKWYSWNKIQ